jgi:hypothetical protein
MTVIFVIQSKLLRKYIFVNSKEVNMSYELDMKEIERKAYRSYSEDGLVDIAIGAVILLWGVFLVTEPSGFIGLLGVLAFAIWYLGKRFITIPRIGMIHPSQKMEKKTRNLTITLLVLGVIALGSVSIGVIFVGKPPIDYSLSILGLVIAGGVCVLAYLLNASRIYAYAFLIFAAFAGGEILSQTITAIDAFALSVIIAGVLILLSGLIVMVRFVRKYPVPTIEA